MTYLRDICNNDVMTMSKWAIKNAIPKLPPVEPWRVSLLSKLLQIRFSGDYIQHNISKQQNDQWIESLCIWGCFLII